MLRRKLGLSNLDVSVFCLGTMTFGEQTDSASASALLDQAFAGGVNFIDTAEMYPAPARAETYGESERIVGQWLHKRGRRQDVVLATKACGPADFVPWIRAGRSRHQSLDLEAAVNASLHRLRTDYIDLFQLHWPDRAANYFGQLGFKPAKQEREFSIENTLRALSNLVASGKIRHIGVCNETAWGAMQFVQIARAHAYPDLVSVQNPYNLLNRSVEVGLSEVAWREGVSLIAYSPLASGLLTGKYHAGCADDGARLRRYQHYRRYNNPRVLDAAARYLAIAADAAIDATHMALAWCASKPAVASVIIGATTSAQLEHNLEALNLELPRAVASAIDAVHEEISNPCP